jgi:hypothetical protein
MHTHLSIEHLAEIAFHAEEMQNHAKEAIKHHEAGAHEAAFVHTLKAQAHLLHLKHHTEEAVKHTLKDGQEV